MSGQVELYKAIVDKLRTDVGSGGLVELTGHAVNNLRIIKYQPPLKAVQPVLSVRIMESIPLNGNVTLIQKTSVQFASISTDDVKALRILDRLETLFDFEDNRSFYDFSNEYIKTQGVVLQLRNDPIFITGDDIWRQEMLTEVIWSKVPCPS